MSNIIENKTNINDQISDSIQFWFYLISNILSAVCCFINLFYLFFDRTLRNALNNHIFIIILFICLIYELINIPIIVYNYFFNIPLQIISIFYKFWSFIDIGFYTIQLIIFAWATIEQHILIFHGQWLSTEKKRFYIHYLPIIILIIYCFTWYSVLLLFSSCINIDLYSCVWNNSKIRYFDLICHQIIPSLIIIISSTAFLLRIRWSKTHFHREKSRSMIFQTLSISILYFVFYGPWLFVLICFQFDFLETIGLKLAPYAYFMSYYFIFLLPFVCYTSLPEIHLKLKKLICR